jgi:CheY-like chemotaxis protein
MAKILVADDEPIHQEFVATILMRAGHSVIAVGNGVECLRQLDKTAVDIVVADIFMPHLDGIQMLAMMRAQGRRVPIIGMTGG